MKKGKAKRNGWFYVAIGALLVSMLSLFTPIITYTEGTRPISFLRILGLNAGSGSSYGSFKTYNIIDLLKGDSLVKEVLTFYRGEVFWKIDTPEIIAMALLVIVSLTASLVGITGDLLCGESVAEGIFGGDPVRHCTCDHACGGIDQYYSCSVQTIQCAEGDSAESQSGKPDLDGRRSQPAKAAVRIFRKIQMKHLLIARRRKQNGLSEMRCF